MMNLPKAIGRRSIFREVSGKVLDGEPTGSGSNRSEK